MDLIGSGFQQFRSFHEQLVQQCVKFPRNRAMGDWVIDFLTRSTTDPR